MPSGLMGRQVALSIVDMIQAGATAPTRTASMSSMGAACASAGAGVFKGTAASMTMFPVVPDRGVPPEHGRSLQDTTGEIGLAGHWVKHFLHYMFIYKAKALPGWSLIPGEGPDVPEQSDRAAQPAEPVAYPGVGRLDRAGTDAGHRADADQRCPTSCTGSPGSTCGWRR